MIVKKRGSPKQSEEEDSQQLKLAKMSGINPLLSSPPVPSTKMQTSRRSPLSIPAGQLPYKTTTTRPKRRLRRLLMSLNQDPNFLTSVTKLLWGQSLPPQLLISTVRSTWSAAWHLMMSQMAPSDPSGSYSRPSSKFRLQPHFPVSRPNEHLHLYVGLACPWAHRTLIVRALKGLEDSVTLSVASPGVDGSWEFWDSPAAGDQEKLLVPTSDKAQGCKTLREVYNLRQGGYNGRSTVPMLWDAEQKDVLCNESYDIILLFNSGLNGIAKNPGLDLAPPSLIKKIDEWIAIIYPNVNNGVYRY